MNSCTAMMEYVLAPKRIKAWLIGMDALLQSLVSTSCLCDKEREELLAYYSQGEQEDEYVAIERLPRPCHRLDKVTSGVLLLAVSHASARRVGEAISRKTQQMEETLLERLHCLTGDEKGAAEEVLSKFYVGVRKRYLARVHGLFPQRAVAASGPRYMENTEEKNNAKSTAGSGLFVLPGDCNKEYEASGFKCSDEAVRQASGGVVFASQLRQYKFSEVAAEGDTADQRSNPGSKEVFYQDAVTLCQPVRYYGRGSGPEGTATYGGREESLIHCVPFSGRLHQIRMHLSDWYHPIVGDVTYYVCENETDAHRRDRRTLFFCEEELPGSYREAFHKHDDLCWECNQRLPIASYDNSNGSTVALHAWRYEIDHHLLLSREGSVHCDSEQDTGCGAAGQACIVDTALSVHCCWGDVISKVTRSVERRGSVVIFSAPPPDWALE
ncbi:putative RNA pseudouridylate synthase [Trypanosoma vivax]|nr:putative RNA pseudouridylate synthase [Trypanosoma vivax]